MSNTQKTILYISPDGMLEPLGDSQVLKYLEKLSKNFAITLISFEKIEDLRCKERLQHIQDRCLKCNIDWQYKHYRQGIFVLSYLVNILNFMFSPLLVLMQQKISIIHIRSYMPGLSIPLLSLFFNFKLLFDIRGFWVDEKHDRLGWKKNSLKYLFFKKLEHYLFKRADAVVTLTHGAKNYISIHFKKSFKAISVIRTCVDFDEFRVDVAKQENPNLVIGYLGSTDTAYDFDQFLNFISDVRRFDSFLEVHFLTRSTTEEIKFFLRKHDLEDLIFQNQFLARGELSDAISKFDVLAFCLKENFSIQASMPTKIGEALACGIPILCNSFNGDIASIMQNEGVGQIHHFHKPFSKEAYKKLMVMVKTPQIGLICSNFSKKEFSLTSGAASYAKIYQEL
jgi:glycosyltransferase involved in cell wall biosynthesis